MTDLFAELEWRGFVHHATPGLKAHLAKGPVSAYCGFDPTAPSLQLGNLMPIMLLLQLQRAGHRPIVVMGGGTGLIGDPSGKRTERPLLSKEQIREHLQRMRDQMQRFLDFDARDTGALVVNNADWLVEQRLVDFLRDVGKHFTVNVMLQKESVQARLEGGLSYTEFSYMLLQAFDFLQLFRGHRCTLQVGGSDQWGNITAGVDLIRRIENGEAHGLVHPLITTASGAKFGKSDAGAAIYLDPRQVEPGAFDSMAQEIPTSTVTTRDGLTIVDALVQVGLVKSKSEARRAIEQGGVYVNQQRVKEADRTFESGDWLAGRNVLLRKGKKDYALLRLA